MLGQDGLEMGLVLAFGSDLEVHLFNWHLQTIFGPNFGAHLGPCWDQKWTKIEVFGVPRACPRPDGFWSRFLIHFGMIFKGLAESKIRVSYGRVAFLLIFRRFEIRFDFASILGGSWGGFWELFGRFWLDFGGFKGVEFRGRS